MCLRGAALSSPADLGVVDEGCGQDEASCFHVRGLLDCACPRLERAYRHNSIYNSLIPSRLIQFLEIANSNFTIVALSKFGGAGIKLSQPGPP